MDGLTEAGQRSRATAQGLAKRRLCIARLLIPLHTRAHKRTHTQAEKKIKAAGGAVLLTA